MEIFQHSSQAHSKEYDIISFDYRNFKILLLFLRLARYVLSASAYCYGGRRRMENGEHEPTLGVAMGSFLSRYEHLVCRSSCTAHRPYRPDRPHDTSRVTSVTSNMPRAETC